MTSHARQILTDELQLCFSEGFRAFVKRGGRQYENPYGPATQRHAAYRAGWSYGIDNLAARGAAARPAIRAAVRLGAG